MASLVGLAAGAFFAPMIAAATNWFNDNRSLAVSLVSAGMGVAPMTISPFARWLISTYDWRTAMMTIGIMAWAAADSRRRFWCGSRQTATAGVAAAGPETVAAEPGMSAGAGAPLAAIHRAGADLLACCAAHSGPIFHMVSYAIGCGIAPMAAVSIYSVEGLAGLGGRLLLGLVADRFGAKRVLIAGLLVQSAAIASYLLVNRLDEFYTLADRLRHRLWRGYAALCGAGARIFWPGGDGNRVRRHDHGLQHRHGLRALGGRPDL